MINWWETLATNSQKQPAAWSDTKLALEAQEAVPRSHIDAASPR